jgi:hypothetical protein
VGHAAAGELDRPIAATDADVEAAREMMSASASCSAIRIGW